MRVGSRDEGRGLAHGRLGGGEGMGGDGRRFGVSGNREKAGQLGAVVQGRGRGWNLLLELEGASVVGDVLRVVRRERVSFDIEESRRRVMQVPCEV